MKFLFSLFISDARVRALFFFEILFFSGMWISKTVQPLWFDFAGNLYLFSLAGTMMSLAGYASVFWGTFLDRYGIRPMIFWGSVSYSFGLFLRIYNESLPLALISGFFSGLGASAVLVCLEPWVMNIFDREHYTHGVAMSQFSNKMGMACGCLLAGLLPFLFINEVASYKPQLVLSALLVFLTIFLAPQKNQYVHDQKKTRYKITDEIKSNMFLLGGYAFFSMIAGVYVGLIVPYFPVILKDLQLDLFSIGTLTALCSIFSSVLQPMFATGIQKYKVYKFAFYLFAESFFACMIAVMIFPLSLWMVVVVMLLRAIMKSFGILIEQSTWMECFEKEKAGFYFGFAKSIFFATQSCGFLLSLWILENYSIKHLLLTGASLVFLNGICFVLYQHVLQKKRAHHE